MGGGNGWWGGEESWADEGNGMGIREDEGEGGWQSNGS